MSVGLNSGKGRCPAEASLQFRPPNVVFELGAAPDVFSAVLAAVHHANRAGGASDYLAVAFPEIRKKHGGCVHGGVVEILGSEKRLAQLLQFDGIETLKRREMILPLEIEGVYAGPGDIGAAYVRDRSGEKLTPGWIRRQRARAERRGRPWTSNPKPRAHDPSLLVLRYGDRFVCVREIVAEVGTRDLMVSTYGFSGPTEKTMAVLPVMPESAREGLSAT